MADDRAAGPTAGPRAELRPDWKPARGFRSTINRLYGAEGRAWIAELPAIVGEFASARGLTVCCNRRTAAHLRGRP